MPVTRPDFVNQPTRRVLHLPCFSLIGSQFVRYQSLQRLQSFTNFSLVYQGEEACHKRIKKFELAIAGLREQVAALARSEQRAAEKTARAEARAVTAESAECELRKAVEAIKHDFEVRRALEIRRLSSIRQSLHMHQIYLPFFAGLCKFLACSSTSGDSIEKSMVTVVVVCFLD